MADSPQKQLDRLHLLFAVSALAFLAVFLVAAYQDHNREWKHYQRDFKQLELAKTSDPTAKAKVRSRGYDIQQYWLPDLVVEPRDSRGVADRCTTCHLGISRAAFADAPQPFRSHPGLDSWFPKHNVDMIGCVVCHEGQGPATTVEKAHGPIHHWLEPVLRGKHIQAACMKCHAITDTIPGLETLQKGQEIAEKFKCNICHKVVGEGGSVGPEMVDIYKKVDTSTGILHELDWHERHFKNPRDTSDDTSAMPNFMFNAEDMEAILTYILALNTKQVDRRVWAKSLVEAKGKALPPLPALSFPPLPPIGQEESPPIPPPAQKKGKKGQSSATPVPGPTVSLDQVRVLRKQYIVAGKKLFETVGCLACHSVNADPHHRERGKVGPDFVNLAGGEREEAWIVDFLTLPPKYFPGLPMPPYPQLSLVQRRQLALYLLSPKLPEESKEPKSPIARSLKAMIGYRKPAEKKT